MARLVIAVLVLAACAASGTQPVGVQPSWRGGRGATSVSGAVTLAASAEPEREYNRPAGPPPSSVLGDAVVAAVTAAAKRGGVPVPTPDARLFRACAELAAVAPRDGSMPYPLIEFALQRNGIIEPSPHMLVIWGNADSPSDVIERIEPSLADFFAGGATARIGVGASRRDGSVTVVFAMQGSAVSTLPIPRSIAAGQSAVIDAVVASGYRDPEVFVTYDNGTTETLALGPGRPGGFTARLACGGRRGRQQLEIAASGAVGPTVLANFPVWCGEAPPETMTVGRPHDDVAPASAEDAERRLFDSVNRDRVVAGIPALIWDVKVAAVARTYSDEMRRTHVVAHHSPTSGRAADRLRAANIRVLGVLENLALAYGLAEAHDGLMNSPGHRANLMSTMVTHGGIGVAFGEEVGGRRELFITQVFTRPAMDASKARGLVERKLAAARPGLAFSALLGPLAQQLASALAAGQTREAAYAAIKPQAENLGNTYRKISTVITATADPESLEGASLVSDDVAQEIGVGVATGPHPEIGADTMWVVLLFANRVAPPR